MFNLFGAAAKTEGSRLPLSLRLEGRALPECLIRREFDLFYSQCLRREAGASIEASALLDAHVAWAECNGCGSISFKEQRALMEAKRHRHHRSNRIKYRDVRFARVDEAPALAPGRPQALIGEAELEAAIRDCLAAATRMARLVGLAI